MRPKINCLGQMVTNGLEKVRREGLVTDWCQGTVKVCGGSVIVWGCMTWEGVGYAAKIDGRMDGDLYLQF